MAERPTAASPQSDRAAAAQKDMPVTAGVLPVPSPPPETAEEPVGGTTSGPFMFLDYFREADRAKFAGRDRDIAALVAQITHARTTVLYGRSGLGKTSLLLAGVLPELRSRGFLSVYVRTLESPVDDLAKSVSAALENIGGTEASDTSDDLLTLSARSPVIDDLRKLSARSPVIIVLDQFEEFFIRFRTARDKRRAFVDTVVATVGDTTMDVRVVFSLREDYLAALDDFSDALPDLFANAYRLQPLTAFGARKAILQPLIVHGVSYDRRLVAAIVDELADYGYDPPLLQILCTEVYRVASQRSQGEISLTTDDLRKVRGLKTIFQHFVSRLVKRIPNELEFLAKMVLAALITHEGTKEAVKAETLTRKDFVANLSEVEEVLDHLVRGKIVRKDERNSVLWYELIHEHIVPVVQTWLNNDREFFDFRQTMDFVINLSKGSDWRERGDRLMQKGLIEDLVARFRERIRLDDDQKEFMVRSCIAAETRDCGYWVSVFGTDQSQELVREMMRNDEASIRGAAARMAASILAQNADAASLHLELALTDPDDKVRRSNGAAFAGLAESAHLKDLRGRLDDPQTRERGLEVLADVYGEFR